MVRSCRWWILGSLENGFWRRGCEKFCQLRGPFSMVCREVQTFQPTRFDRDCPGLSYVVPVSRFACQYQNRHFTPFLPFFPIFCHSCENSLGLITDKSTLRPGLADKIRLKFGTRSKCMYSVFE